jgi:hypothetical protein
MDQKRYEVEITFRQTLRFAVDASNRRVAEREAMDLWQTGADDAMVGSECCELVEVRTEPVPCDERCGKEAEDAYRYLRDRELVIETLDPDAFNPTVHDAVSAEEVALHLGWKRRGNGSDGSPDIPRAARALDRLCDERRVVCFTRERMRLGEKGEIRLYCTPQHLALLSAIVMADEMAAGAAS